MAMTLEQAGKQIKAFATASDRSDPSVKNHYVEMNVLVMDDWWQAINAHLTQPAQAVDVVKLMEHLPDNRAATRAELIRALALTRALAGEQAGWRGMDSAPKDGSEVLATDGEARFVMRYTQFHGWVHAAPAVAIPKLWQPLPASPTPEKETQR